MSDPGAVPPEVTDEVPAARPLIVGRGDELDIILSYVNTLREGRGGTLGIRADSGLGKTHLAREAVDRVAPAQIKAELIACRGTLHRPYSPLAMLVRSLLDIAADWRAREQFGALEMALTELGVRDPNQTLARLLNVLPVEATGSLEDSQGEAEDRFEDTQVGATALTELPDIIASLFGKIAEKAGGLFVIFDDLDEAHPRTIELVTRLIAKANGLPVAFGATFAPHPPGDLQTTFGGKMITLSNLTQDATLMLGALLAGAKRLSKAMGEMVWKATDGDPLFISLLFGDLVREGRLKISRGEASLTGKDIPATLIQLINGHASRLDESQRETLTCAAVLGDGFRMGALTVLRGRVMPVVLETELQALIEDGWIVRAGKGRQINYSFTHRIKRKMIYKNTPDDRRQALHKNAGDYYAVVTAGRRIRVENAMHHYLLSGDTRRALPVIEIAINKARASGDQEHLMTLYQMGVEAAAADPSLGQKQIEMAEYLGDMVAAFSDYAQAADIYTRHSPPVTSPMVLAKLGLVTLAIEPTRAANVLSRALAAMGSGANEDLRWTIEASLCWALSLSGSGYEAIRRCRDAMGRLGDTVGFGAARSLMRAMLGIILFYEGDLQEAHPHLESARAGWGARGYQEGVTLINQVLIGMPKTDITRAWLKLALTPILKK